MKRKKINKKRLITIVIAEALCLILVIAAALLLLSSRAEKEREAARQQEIAEQQARAEEEEKQKKQEVLDEWNLILVNNQNAIPDDYDPEIADVESGYSVDARIKDALEEMLSDCREAGHSPQIISAYRSHETQQYLYDRTANKADTAVPGHSEHECGLAVDIIDSSTAGWSDPLIDAQEDTEAQKWLMENCQNYGFILRYPKDKEDFTEIIYEPWHYRYVGKDHAEEIMKRGICLEEYIDELKNG